MIDNILNQKEHWDALALSNLRPGSPFVVYEGGIQYVEEKNHQGESTGRIIFKNFVWEDQNVDHPTRQEITAKVQELQNQYLKTKYQRQRQLEYPPLSDLADALYWQSQGDESKMTAYLAAVETVKAKYPKGNQ
jgi:hypothetical protein